MQSVRWSKRPTLRLITSRTQVLTTANHGWLQARDFRWSCAHQLSRGRRLRYVPVLPDEKTDDDYRVGYLAGLTLGDGTFRYEPGWRSTSLGFPAAYWRVALTDEEPLARAVEYLRAFGVEAHIRPFSASSKKPMKAVQTCSLRRLGVIHRLLSAQLDSPSQLPWLSRGLLRRGRQQRRFASDLAGRYAGSRARREVCAAARVRLQARTTSWESKHTQAGRSAAGQDSILLCVQTSDSRGKSMFRASR